MSRKLVAFFPAHPSQIWVLKQAAEKTSSFADVLWFLRDKDISTTLADDLGIEYTLISRAGTGFIGNGTEFLKNMFRAAELNRKKDIDLWVTKYGAFHIASRFQGRKSLGFIDDDIDLIPIIAWTSYPFVDEIIAPEVTRMGIWKRKTNRFSGNFELSYLHPDIFTPDANINEFLGIDSGSRFAVVRLSSLSAHHDLGRKGLNTVLLREVIKISSRESISIFITSENPLDSEFEQFRMPIPPSKIHSTLANAEFVLGDSQTMIQEAAVLGTPAFRINDFVGRISIMNELERMELSQGFRPGSEKQLITSLKELLAMENRETVFLERRRRLLEIWEDPTPLIVSRIRHLLDLEVAV
ncbi:MAG: DUF354 domain-containing protein [Candidatus Fermentibacteraceae bacterium]|nr:DUF354 domain-containing protein [Candidatus Fermentibacteraceae bacterium]